MTDSVIHKFYLAEGKLTNQNLNFWQHMSGLFHWYISDDNVSLCCPEMDLEKIAWPEKSINTLSEGV